VSLREPLQRLTAAAESAVESIDKERTRLSSGAPISPRVAPPREAVTTVVREPILREVSGGRGRALAREQSAKVTIGRINIQVINQSQEKASETTRTIRNPGADEYDSIGRRLLGRFDLA
jgi:hypothetical protein